MEAGAKTKLRVWKQGLGDKLQKPKYQNNPDEREKKIQRKI
jgi:hypothetical protein